MKHFGDRSQTVCGATGIGNHGQLGVIALVVDTHDEHGGICGRSRNNDFLGSAVEVSRSFFRGGENTSGLDHVLGTNRGPGNIFRVSFAKDRNFLTIDNKLSVTV